MTPLISSEEKRTRTTSTGVDGVPDRLAAERKLTKKAGISMWLDGGDVGNYVTLQPDGHFD